MTRIITSCPGFKHPPSSWMGYSVRNILRPREPGEGVSVKPKYRSLFADKFGPTLGDMLSYTTVHGSIFLDSDIALTTPSLSAYPSTVTYARRIETPSCRINPWAVAFIVLPFDVKLRLQEHTGWQQLQWGCPWWQTIILTASVLLGYKLQRIEAPVAFHASHERAWSWKDWEIAGEYARSFLIQLAERAGADGFPKVPNLSRFHDRVRAWRELHTVRIDMEVAPSPIQVALWNHVNKPERWWSRWR
jgi:hypothetical protein